MKKLYQGGECRSEKSCIKAGSVEVKKLYQGWECRSKKGVSRRRV